MTFYNNPDYAEWLHPDKISKYMGGDKISYEGIESKFDDNLNLPIIYIQDLKYSNINGLDHIYIPGKTYLAAGWMPYYHAVTDGIGVYEYIKGTHEPELKFILAESWLSREMNMGLQEPTPATYEYWNWSQLRIDLTKANYHFETIVFMPTDSIWGDMRKIPYELQHAVGEFEYEQCFTIKPQMFETARNQLIAAVDTSTPIKIYSTRIPTKEFYCRTRRITKEQEADNLARIYDDEKIIQDYFVDKGYIIIDNAVLSIKDQAELYAKASHIAGLAGTNMFNAIYSKPGSQVFYIHTSSYWYYDYLHYYRYYGQQINEVCRSDIESADFDPSWKVPVENIIAELDRLEL